MSTLWKRRIAILAGLVLAFGLACSCRLLKGTSISFSAFADEPTFAQIGTASLSDAGNTLFIRMAKFNVGTEEKPEIRYCSGFTVGDLGPEDAPTQNVNMDVLTPIWPDAPLTGTLDKDIYICGGTDGKQADLYVNGLTQTEGHKLTAVGSFDVKMGALSVGEMIAPTAGVNIGDKASVTVNGNASLNYLWMYKPSLNVLQAGQADPRTYNPQLLGGTLHVTGNLSGGSGGYLYIDGGSAATVDGDVSGLCNNDWQCIQVSSEGSLTVGGGISVPGGVAISNSTLSVTEGISAKNVVVNEGSAMNVGGDLSVPNGGQIWAMESDFTVGGSVNGSEVYIHGLPETATVGGNVTANNLWVSGTGNASTSKTALTVTGDVTVSANLDINRCATVTADNVICNYLYMEEAGPNVLNAATFKCTYNSCLYRNSTLNVTGDCKLDTPFFNVQGDSHVNVGGDLTVKNFIDVQDKSSLTVEGNVSFTEAYSYQLQAFGSGVITCKGNVAAKGAVSALWGGKIAVTGTLSSTDVLSVNAMGSGSEITAAVIDAKTVNAISGGKIAVADKLSAKTYALSVNALYGGSEITADAIDAEGCVSAIGNARVSVTGTLTTGDLGSLGVLAIGKDAVIEAENISAPYINALGYYSGEGGSGTSAVIVRNDANLSQWPVVDDGGTISVGGDLNCTSFSIYKQSRWNSEYTGWIHVGGDMCYAENAGDISRGELTVGGDFINTAPNPGYGDGLAVYGGKLNVGGNVEFGSLLLNTRGDNTPLNVTGRINAARITDIIAKDANDEPLKLHTIAPFEYAMANDEGFIPYQQPWDTQYVLLEDDIGNGYRVDISDLTRTSYALDPSVSFTYILNDRAVWKNAMPSIGYSGASINLPTGEDMTYADGVYALTGWSANADGSGAVYAPGESVTLNGDSTFYALWSYCVNTPEPIVAGTVTAQAAAAPGDTVVLTLTPGENYEIGSVSYSYNDGTDDHTVSVDPADGAYSFVMPEHGVSVSATWKKCLTHADISVEIPSTVYTGEVLSPAVTVKDGDQTLAVNSDYTVALPEGRINAGDYTVTVSAAENSASYSGSATATFSIAPASVTLTANSDTKTYTGETYTVEGFTPSVEGLIFAETVKASGSGTNAGAYDVTFTGVTLNETKDTTGNYVVTGMTDGKLTIDKAAPVDVTVPTAKTLTYDGSAQALVTAGTATGGEMQYALGTANEATQPYTTSIPTATDAGTYYIWYKVEGDGNHNDTEAKSVPVSISPVDKAALNEAVGSAETYYDSIKDNADYAEIAAALKMAIDSAKSVAANDNALQAAVDDAISSVKAAVDTAKAGISAAEEAAKKVAEEEAAKKAAEEEAAKKAAEEEAAKKAAEEEAAKKAAEEEAAKKAAEEEAARKAAEEEAARKAAEEAAKKAAEEEAARKAAEEEAARKAAEEEAARKAAEEEAARKAAEEEAAKKAAEEEAAKKAAEEEAARKAAAEAAAQQAPEQSTGFKGGVYEYKSGRYLVNADMTATYMEPVKSKSKIKTVSIPDEIVVEGKNIPVTAIAEKAFYKAKKLKKVTIGKNIVTIGKRAFRSCKRLVKITVKTKKLTSVGKSAFKGISYSATFKCPKKQLKEYKKLFKGAGAPKEAKFKKY